ncbi:MAG TPA: hypothetical protein DEO86_09600 [Colwellia sp.]|nr:hypothetical protein [Colwellia sp.]
MQKTLIFSQSPKDIQFVLAVMSHPDFKDFNFDIVVTSKECFSFLSTLELGNHIKLYDYSLSSKGKLGAIFNYLFVNRLKLSQLERQYSADNSVKEVMFFSCYFDLLTLSFYLRNINKLNFTFVDIFKIKRISNVNITQLSFLKRLKQKYLILVFSKELQFSFENGNDIVGIDTGNFSDSYDKYFGNLNNSLYLSNLYAPNVAANKRSILLYDSDISELGHEVAVKGTELLIEVLGLFEKMGFDIYIKEHPRLGGSGIADIFKSAHLISSSIPSEFIDRTSFDFELAISSAALESSSSDVNAIALIRLLENIVSNNLGPQVKQMENIDNVIMIKELAELKGILNDSY